MKINILITDWFADILIWCTVKYLREVTPYFRKTSVLGDVGWTAPEQTARDILAPKSSDGGGESKTIPLRLCFLCRNLNVIDPHNVTLELHSPDGKNSVYLRCPDDRIAGQWFAALHACIDSLTQSALRETNYILSEAASNTREVKHMGWLAEHVSVFIFLASDISTSI